MKQYILVLSVVISTLTATAQTTEPDTMTVHELKEVVIQAPKVIRKADMDVYHPSKSAVENAKNGMQLLNNLMIPTLTVNDALGSIQAAGQSVQIRINGRESSVDQIKALTPESIKRVEWIDNPGLRYGGASYVMNIIVSNPTAGGSLTAIAEPALNTAWGFYMADIKFNNGHSQWEIGGNFKLTEQMKTHREYTETFTYPDGTSLTRDEASRGGSGDASLANARIAYNYIKPDTTVFMAGLTFYRNMDEKWLYNGLLSLSDGSDEILLSDSRGDNGSKPSLYLYLQQNFRNRQMLIIDISSSFYFGRSFSDYLERHPDASSYITDIHTCIKDRNQAYAFEADYIKNWTNSRFTAGASYSANRNRSEYENLAGQVFHQRQDKAYFFAEYFHRFGKWSATAGMGLQYTEFLFKESDRGNHSWSPRPQATITYSPNRNHSFRLNFTSWQSAPSLAETNVVPQQLDGFQWLAGNQNLKTTSSYMLTFRYGFNIPRVSGSFGVHALTSPDAITPLLMWEGEKLITTYENSRGMQSLSLFLAPQIDIIPKWLMASGYIEYRTERMKGTGYEYNNNGWSGNAAVRLTHWGFTLSGQYMRAQRNLWGEKISWGESINVINLSYSHKNWQFLGGIIMPFGEYDRGSKSLSRWNRNEQHMRLDMRIPYIEVSYNLQWGRQKHKSEKLIDSNANADHSKTGGR